MGEVKEDEREVLRDGRGRRKERESEREGKEDESCSALIVLLLSDSLI